MLTDVCSILLAFAAGSISDDPTATLKGAWFTGVVSDNRIWPLETELLRNKTNRTHVPKEFRDGTAPMSGGGIDCTEQLLSAGLTLGPWPKSGLGDEMSVSPNRQPAITFNPMRFSKSGRYVLVSWLSSYGPEASAFGFAILEHKKQGWRIIRLGSFGPVS